MEYAGWLPPDIRDLRRWFYYRFRRHIKGIRILGFTWVRK